jgi:hypothetical protein
MNIWLVCILIYVALATLTFVPTLRAIFRRVQLFDGGASFKDSTYFSEDAVAKLMQHESRIQGTLLFWKNEANKYKQFHYYTLIWTTFSSTLIPILAQAITEDFFSKLLITIISGHIALLLAFHRAFKVDKNFQAFRQGESEFYDLRRRLLDRPHTLGANEKKQLDTYFEQVEIIRKFVRNAETDNFPVLDTTKQQPTPSTPTASE